MSSAAKQTEKNPCNQIILQEVGLARTTQLLLGSVLTKQMKPGRRLGAKHQLKLDSSAVAENAHLSGEFRGDAWKPAVAQVLHLKRKKELLWLRQGANLKCTSV